MIKRKALESLKPDVIIEVNGKKVKISNVTSVKTAVQEWTLDEPSKYDPGSGTEETFINAVEVNNKSGGFSKFLYKFCAQPCIFLFLFFLNLYSRSTFSFAHQRRW